MDDKTPADILANAKDLASKEQTENRLLQVKGSVNGAVTGLVIGLMVGYYKKYNLMLAGTAGVLIGGAVSYYFLKEERTIIKK